MFVGVSVGVAVGASVDVYVADRGLPWHIVGAAVDLAVDISANGSMASCMGLHGVTRFPTQLRRSPWNVRGKP